MTTFDIITFDLFGALMETRYSLFIRLNDLLSKWMSPVEVEHLVDDWIHSYASFYGSRFNDNLTHHPFTYVIENSLATLLKKRDMSVSNDSQLFRELCDAWKYLRPHPDALRVLKILSSKYHLGIMSNGNKQLTESILRYALPGIKFHVIISSDYPVNAFKPNQRVYESLLSLYPRDKICHVAGAPVDAFGALNQGLKVILFRNEPLPGELRPHRIYHMNDLLNLLM